MLRAIERTHTSRALDPDHDVLQSGIDLATGDEKFGKVRPIDENKVDRPVFAVLRKQPAAVRQKTAPGLNSNAPFAAEVQSNVEQSCCSNPVTPAGRNRYEGLTRVGEDGGCARCRLIAPDDAPKRGAPTFPKSPPTTEE